MPIPPYPLAWPDGLPRTPAVSITAGAFKTTLAGAQSNVGDELRRFGTDTSRRVTDVVLTSNMTGLGPPPADRGVAVWFMWDGAQRVFAVDRYATVSANLQAIAKVIEAQRAIMRHGGLNIVRATFRGFAALPAPASDWRRLLLFAPGEEATKSEVTARYRKFAMDAASDEPKLLQLNLARDAAVREIEGSK